MSHTEIKPLYESSNLFIVQLSTRKFPSIVLQGNTFYSIYKDIQSVKKKADPNQAIELLEEIDDLESRFKAILNVYEKVPLDNKMDLPYNHL